MLQAGIAVSGSSSHWTSPDSCISPWLRHCPLPEWFSGTSLSIFRGANCSILICLLLTFFVGQLFSRLQLNVNTLRIKNGDDFISVITFELLTLINEFKCPSLVVSSMTPDHECSGCPGAVDTTPTLLLTIRTLARPAGRGKANTYEQTRVYIIEMQNHKHTCSLDQCCTLKQSEALTSLCLFSCSCSLVCLLWINKLIEGCLFVVGVTQIFLWNVYMLHIESTTYTLMYGFTVSALLTDDTVYKLEKSSAEGKKPATVVF